MWYFDGAIWRLKTGQDRGEGASQDRIKFAFSACTDVLRDA